VSAAQDLGGRVGVAPACRALGVARATLYRRRAARTCPRSQQPRPPSPRALSIDERLAVLAVLNEERFCDLSPAAVWAMLLDEGRYLCSPRTMYRILAASGAVRERRNQLRHPAYKKPELLATAPNQVWSWDITKLKGPVKWSTFYLYVLLDIYSRNVVGWMLAECESGALATALIEQSCEKQGVEADQLTIHSDRGPPMISKPVAFLLADLGVTKSHSRPYTSNDNPFSESHFRTMKYRPDFPARFGCIQDARAHCRAFFRWYNHEHRHSSLGLLTPDTVHYGRAEAAAAARSVVLDAAYAAHPERFVRRPPAPPALPTETWINPPARELAALETARQEAAQ
jgi:putative transposase